MPAPIAVTHFTDPGCPWAYSASPALTLLQWRYGDQLAWRHVMIGLTEDAQRYVDRGYTPAKMAKGYRNFRRLGMPFATQPRPRVGATSPMCRTIVAARLAHPEREVEVFRALQFAQFASPLVLDEVDGIRQALRRVDGIDADALLGAIESPEVWEAYEADRAETRTAEGGPTQFQGKSANSDGAERFTAPSLKLERASDGFVLEAGGFQPVEAYDVCIANLDTTLSRRPPAADPVEALEAFPYALVTREVTALLATHLGDWDDDTTEDRLIEAAGDGHVVREGLGAGALWHLADRVPEAVASGAALATAS
jgi:protein-disulfide isomerase-like protein with CxxC motif